MKASTQASLQKKTGILVAVLALFLEIVFILDRFHMVNFERKYGALVLIILFVIIYLSVFHLYLGIKNILLDYFKLTYNRHHPLLKWFFIVWAVAITYCFCHYLRDCMSYSY